MAIVRGQQREEKGEKAKKIDKKKDKHVTKICYARDHDKKQLDYTRALVSELSHDRVHRAGS